MTGASRLPNDVAEIATVDGLRNPRGSRSDEQVSPANLRTSMYAIAQQSFSGNVIQYYLQRLSTPSGVMLVVAMVMLATAVLAVDRFKWVALTISIFLSTFAYNRSGGTVDLVDVVALPAPFSVIASLTQPLGVACLLIIAIASMKPMPWQRLHAVHPVAIGTFAIQALIALRQLAGGLPERGIVGVAIYGSVLLILGARTVSMAV